MGGAVTIEHLLRRDRAVVVTALVAVVIASWTYVLSGAGMDMGAKDAISMPVADWSPSYFGMMLAMWAVMMAAMMLAGAAPMILLFAKLSRGRAQGGAVPTGIFALGYLAIWTVFSVGATTLQWALGEAALMSPLMRTSSTGLAAALLIGAGLYQWTPLKQACLRRCRSPLDFVLSFWREGAWGAFAMGVRHALYCVGCCWALMLLLFAGGVMSLAWIGGLAAFVLVEKTAPGGHWIGRAAGVALVAWGVSLLFALG